MSLKEIYRDITVQEIEKLQINGCSCDEWGNVKVKDEFNPDRFKDVIFSGNIRLGVFTNHFVDESGVSTPTGIYNARLHNCIVGSEVIISNIGVYIANYNIQDKVIIKNCGKIHTEGVTSFGNGTPVSVINETGSRVVKIWDRLSAHEAYIAALYRHRPDTVSAIEKMVDDYALSHSSVTGTIGYNSKIFNCAKIRNVHLGPFSHIDGSTLLNEGSLNSSENGNIFIGPGVIMEHFIVCPGSTVSDAALISKCFIGQNCVISKQFSAENSLFFANCSLFHGEACSIFAGPFTTTHHKSTLLIAGFFSFMNAGSGSNQSNHMYKLGPLHQGIMERGCKTASNSYFWPSHIGPFTSVIGKHPRNLDTSSFPFSYLMESDNESILIPGINLRSSGTVRDAMKWPLRDKRNEIARIDQINFDLLNPFTINNMIEGRNLLHTIRSNAAKGASTYQYGSIKITGASLDRGIELYQNGINKLLGNLLIERLSDTRLNTTEDIRKVLLTGGTGGLGEWVDLAGLFAPRDEVNKLLDRIESLEIRSVEELSESFKEMFNSYHNWEWRWCCEKLEEEFGTPVNKLTVKEIISIIEVWKKSVIDLDNLIYEDAKKEFSLTSMTGYGIDCTDKDKVLDFKQVRGELETNNFVQSVQEHIKNKTDTGNGLIEKLRKVK